jgi:CHASE1-domain containing sensor protein
VDSEEHVFAIRSAIDGNLKELQALTDLCLSMDNESRSMFQALSTRVLERRLGIQAVEWTPRVQHVDRVTLEGRARNDGFPNFQFTERAGKELVRAADRDEYFPVYFAEPVDGNRSALGFDLASDPDRLHALTKACDRALAVATEPIAPVQENGTQAGILVAFPQYDERRDAQEHGWS